MCHRVGMRVTGVDACRHGWVAVRLDVPGPAADRPGSAGAGRIQVAAVRAHASLAGALERDGATVVGIDMPLGLLESGWREADRAARGLLGPRRSSVFAIPPRSVWDLAWSVSILTIRACACGLRSTAACRVPGVIRSAM